MVGHLAGPVEVTVRDDGRGMAREELDRVFDAFYTTREDGTGLGLTIGAPTPRGRAVP